MSTSSTTSRDDWRIMRPRRVVTVLACSASLAVSPTAFGQGRPPIDSGQYEIRSGGRVVGTETFAIRFQEGEYQAVGRLTLEGAPDAFRSVEIGLSCDAGFVPRRYELRVLEGQPTSRAVSRSGRRLRLTSSTEEGERLQEFLADPDLLLLERGVAHHYYFVTRWLAGRSSGPGARLRALVPAQGNVLEVILRGVAADSVRLGAETVTARRYDLELGDEATSVWAASSDGRVLRVAVPARGWTATRISPEVRP